MRNIIILMLIGVALYAVASPVNSWKKLVKKDGLYSSVETHNSSRSKELDPAQDEYPMDYYFPTNDMMYWKKVGTDIVAMTPSEQSVVNSNLQQSITTTTTGDVQLDSILRTIAECSKGGTKTYDEVVAIFKGQVDPKKAKEKVK